jgi:hypothetical protein
MGDSSHLDLEQGPVLGSCELWNKHDLKGRDDDIVARIRRLL